LHEIGNVGGIAALKWYLSHSSSSPVDLFIMAPSCVPSSKYEMGGAKIGLDQLKEINTWPHVIGLGEVMDIEGVTGRNREVLDKISLFAGKPIDGHAPGLRGAALDRYLSAGICSDHETSAIDEAIEKLSKGMHLFIREGSVAKDLTNLIGLITPKYLPLLSLCTDDLSARDLRETGHLDNLLGILVRSGVPLTQALALITTNPAGYFGFSDKKGLGVGKKADIVIFENPEKPEISLTIKNGNIVYRRGDAVKIPESENLASAQPLNVKLPSPEELRIAVQGSKIRVIGVTEGSIVTGDIEYQATVRDGYLAADPDNDILLAYVFDRYRAVSQFGFGFTKGFNLKNGAIGSTYAHDSHNLIVIGDNIEDIHHVAQTLIDGGGGMAARHHGEVSYVPMPYFGLISHLDSSTLLKNEEELMTLAKRMGVCLKNPFFQMSFISLPVIPQLRLTANGLFCVSTSRYVKANH
jgi:adenine deaminase